MAERYAPEVLDHLVRPRNVGEIEANSGVGESGDTACGDVARFTVRIGDGLRLEEVRYRVYGCAACIACGSALAELAEGRDLVSAAAITKDDLLEALGGPLPPGKEHAVTLVLDALHKAFEDGWTRDYDALLADGGYVAPGSGSGKKTVVAAMSGGVDSAVTALLLREAGYNVVACTFRLHDAEPGSRSCCSPDTVLFARDTAHRMGLPHFTLNLKELFGRRVMRDFVGSYAKGSTPNPCVACNAHVKFHAAAYLADRLGYEKVATGHYARVGEGPSLARPEDETKDQTYVLWPMPKELLARTVFPLGEHRKTEVRAIAERNGLAVAYTPESQDICFIPSGNYRDFVGRKVEAAPGEIVAADGTVLGRHAGVANFTVGQRRGLGVSAKTPLYVREVRPETRQVVVGGREDLRTTEILVGATNWFLGVQEAAFVQIRYNGSAVACKVAATEREGVYRVVFEEPVYGVAPGQSAVFYTHDLDRVVGGGRVLRKES
ncbi:trmU: tRNA (5-methylaminomethyl-2-thiouridylate)-methyltransferase [Rubrobacter radiotolerans]|uniref:tRNA-specific 2-thiouridylase MnmA n=1 Tax=Rubrobacter radiotolerans TaxID=42256 RepID=A0A023X389_RUBRA|nr:tRNA 2-thiouridine(34) synthase MnmA [Rubrobacter radiotolerans]AHY46641.1 trmU: tRNA (5-methylaminomethyl-2-thiouridylate)-methyltransferase [Rubrobacter radiotolerans]MDX5894048.1 tRNA 2-thiouridine(34) synthase MnmA [Rubrobacter radiotolerans]SMC05061.1 tRNA-specific 2-thiouridylase [Rubrobacter radiotolerans DSM 5868]